MRIFLTKNNILYGEGDIVSQFDYKGRFLTTVRINKFIVHYKNKLPRLYVNFNSLEYSTKNWTLPVWYLDTYYKKFF